MSLVLCGILLIVWLAMASPAMALVFMLVGPYVIIAALAIAASIVLWLMAKDAVEWWRRYYR
jgi:hypothetical protein